MTEEDAELEELMKEARLLAGQRIGSGGKYIITPRFLGCGGMAVIMEAEDIKLFGRRVAVKVLNLQHAFEKNTAKRFRQEVQAMAKLESPNICAVLDHGEMDDGRYYMVMELLQGQTLDEEINKIGRIADEARLLNIAIQVCVALEEAHGKGIIHRDLKPANIFLATNGSDHVKVMDFGIAKMDPRRHQGIQKLTIETTCFGTPSYMSPEQVEVKPDIDGRADLYSLGIVMYEMAVGDVPIASGESLGKIMIAQITDTPKPMREAFPELSIHPRLDEIVLKLLEKKRENRYPDAASLRRDLEELREKILRERARASSSAFPPPRSAKERRERENAPTEFHNSQDALSVPPRRPEPPAEEKPKAEVNTPTPEPVQADAPKKRFYLAWIVVASLLAVGIIAFAWRQTRPVPPTSSAVRQEPVAVVQPAVRDAVVVPADAGSVAYVPPPPPPPPSSPPPPVLVEPPSRSRDAGRRRGRCIPNFFTGETCP